MKREILFRGKNDGDWVYGDLIYSVNEDQHYIVERTEDALSFPVDEETIGQYTGFKDKNGKKIFEGDIVKVVTINTKETIYGVVKFGKYKDINFEDSCYGFYVEWEEIQLSMFNGEAEGYCFIDMVEIAGNIHDNANLLKGVNKCKSY